jgi:CheY-like chemotaxis protein
MPGQHFASRTILVLEDDENDALLLQRALRQANLANPIHVVRNGEEAIALLSAGEAQGQQSRPGLIITDLKMPLVDGLEFLKWLRHHEPLRTVPLLVLTSSTAESDFVCAYGFGANSYMVKPRTLEELEKLGKVIREYWERCELPPS